MTKRAVTLISGGLDSAVTSYIARKDIGPRGELFALSFYYGQRNEKELELAVELGKLLNVEQHITLEMSLDLLVTSALLGDEDVPEEAPGDEIPVTWVPQRNTAFLTLAAAFAETVDADFIYTGFHILSMPDTRPEFVEAMNKAVNLASKRYVETGRGFSIECPIIRSSKGEIIKIGNDIGVPFDLTWSCYKGDERACGKCGSCRDRLQGFSDAGLVDPLEYEEGT